MELIRGLYNLRDNHKGTVATIGNFDGVHLGHRAVMEQLLSTAQTLASPTSVITFEPLPEEYFLGDRAPSRLTPLCDKLGLLAQLGIDQVLCLPFNSQLANLDAEAFIRDVLVDGLAIKGLVVGDDFRFGKGRSGDFSLLQQKGESTGFEVRQTNTLSDSANDPDRRISSTRIRQALEQGNFRSAEKWLGHPFTMGGRVFHGDRRGRQLGFPTANIHIARRKSPLQGVYAVEVNGIADAPLPAVANIGTRPTFSGKGFQIEVHLLDFSGDLYGQRIQVRWLEKLRSEQRFASLEALVEQIQRDIEQARQFFSGQRRD
ncbi:MAG: bifunctional riboflavin kinase/FAD synthetase [bacterium]